ncbi:MAG: hypothetical protein JSS49_13360 [Planctomycetes bacterium]|nr:hypothetical protein [Planctomycetota bacterium]
MLIELSGKLGDAIYSLAVAKQLHDIHGVTPDVCFGGMHFTSAGIAALLPLLDQPYIGAKHSQYVTGAELQFSEFFLGYDHHQNVVQAMMAFAQTELGLHMPLHSPVAPWLSIEAGDTALTLVNFTGRYRNEHASVDWMPLLANQENLGFIGLPTDYELFCNSIRTDVPFIETPTLLDAAKYIKSSRLFMGNQSSCLAIAIGLGKTVVVESSEDYPNCIFRGRNSEFHGVSAATIQQYGVPVAE